MNPAPPTPDEQRIAIAEALGWKRMPAIPDSGILWSEEKKRAFFVQGGRADVTRKARKMTCDPSDYIPDFTGSLDAIASAVDYLRNANHLQYLEYGSELSKIVAYFNSLPEQEAYYPILTCDATAPQRCEAFLKAIGKWTGGDDE